jgi:hypothetical protein
LTSVQSFNQSLNAAEARIDNVIGSKLESFFELAEYNWMPPRPQSAAGEPSTYVFEMITFLTAYVDSVLIGLNEEIKTRAYRNALFRINRWLMVSELSKCWLTCQDLLCGKDVPRYNEPALANVLADVKFIEDEIRRLEKPALDKVLEEVRQVHS